jgi:hypothetical protein
MKTIISVVAVLALTLALATTAYGQSSVQGYNNQAGQTQSDVAGSQQAGTTEASGGSLPFTGLDVALLAGAGVLLGAAGFGMRRLTRAPDSF